MQKSIQFQRKLMKSKSFNARFTLSDNFDNKGNSDGYFLEYDLPNNKQVQFITIEFQKDAIWN